MVAVDEVAHECQRTMPRVPADGEEEGHTQRRSDRKDMPALRGGEMTMNGDMIREARLAAGLTQAQLAHKLGVAKETVYQWEKRGVTPNKWIQPRLRSFVTQHKRSTNG